MAGPLRIEFPEHSTISPLGEMPIGVHYNDGNDLLLDTRLYMIVD